MLEALASAPLDVAVIAHWRRLVVAMARTIGWGDIVTDARAHASGASLAISARADRLYTATEVNEWAWQRAAGLNDGFHAPGYPAIADEASASRTLQLSSAAESNQRLINLIDAARAQALPVYPDDDLLSIGDGVGSRSYPIASLPEAEAVPWHQLHAISKAIVTGSNGKTTTVRLLAAMLRATGKRTGHSCTDGLFVDGLSIESGDFSGPGGARAILRDIRVEAAVLETARGGMLRRGLGVERADVAVVTNVSADHFGEYGIHDIDDLISAKLVVARAIDRDGTLVLNADDAGLLRHAARLQVARAWFALDDDNPVLVAHRGHGGATCGVLDGVLMLTRGGVRSPLGAIASMPLSVGGIAHYNIANLAGAALAAAMLGLATDLIAGVLMHFGTDPADNPGRLQRWRIGGIDVLLDYAHNPEGLDGFLAIATHERGSGRLGLLLGQAGNRGDEDVRQLAATAARHRPDRVVLKDIDGFMRGRATGEIASILHAQLVDSGVDSAMIEIVLDEVLAARTLIAWARPGDVVALPVHAMRARNAVVVLLDALRDCDWQAGQPLTVTPIGRPAANSASPT